MEDTSVPGPSASARAMAMKKVGGPARKEMRSRATSASACSGSKRRTRTERRPAAPGTRTPLSSPEMWAIGAGISTASAGPRPWTRAINEAFQLSPLCVWSTALGIPGRARGEQDQGDVGGPAGKGARGHRGASDGVGECRRVREGLGSDLEHESGIDLAEGRLDVRRAERVQDGRSHGADAPAGPGQDGGSQTVRDLPRTASPRRTPARAVRPPRWPRAHRPRGREARGAVHHLAAVGSEQGVEGGHVPGPAGAPVAPGLVGYPGRSEAGRHGRAPYPGPALHF